MAWNGKERRNRDVAYAGPDRRRAGGAPRPEPATQEKGERMLELLQGRHRSRASHWEAGEFLE